MPKISVIVPVYKVEKYLHRCVDSILVQNFTDFELILVDDGSPDNCGKICDEYAAKDKRIKVCHRNNGGLSAARNTGLDNASGKYIGFVDSDDYIESKMFEILYSNIEAYEADLSICRTIIDENDHRNYVSSAPENTVFSRDEFFFSSTSGDAVVWNKLYRRDLIEQNGLRFKEGIEIAEDYIFTFKYLYYTKKIVKSNQMLYNYFINWDGQLRKSNPKKVRQLEAYEEVIDFYNQNGLQNYSLKIYPVYLEFFKTYYSMFLDEFNDKTSAKQLKRKFNILMRTKRKEMNITLKNNCWAYEFWHPHLMKLYWYTKAIKRHLTRH